VVQVVTQFLVPKLEEIAVFTHSAKTQSNAWEDIGLAVDAVLALEVDGTYQDVVDVNDVKKIKAEGERPLTYLDLGAALSAQSEKLRKFSKLASKVLSRENRIDSTEVEGAS
jgi:endo-alpha-1,4-polygalactosaminidase (GH114 family)